MAVRHYAESDEIISEINVIPLVDVSLVLLIIFMVTANYLTTYLNVKLPEAQYAEEVSDKNMLFATVTVTRDGPVYLEDDLVDTQELKEKLAGRLAENPRMAVILNVDRRANFGNAVIVLDALQALGIKNTSIATIEGR